MIGNTQSNWNEAARAYAQMKHENPYSCFLKEFAEVNVKDVDGLRVLDAGCGDGEYTELLRQKGARPTGCDCSEKVIQIAKEKYPLCAFDVADLSGEIPYASGRFDMVFSNTVLMDIDPLDTTIAEFARVLKNGGRLFFSIIHPSFYLVEWHRDDAGRIIYKEIDTYLTHKPVEHVWGGNTVPHYHRPLSFYMNLLADNGFCLARLYEPPVYEKEKIPDLPLFLLADYVKTGRA